MRKRFCAFLMLLLMAAFPHAAMGGGGYMEALFRQTSPGSMRLELPMPEGEIKGAAIVTERLPKGIAMVECSPDPSLYHREEGLIKWLVKRPKGVFKINQRLNGPVSAEQLEVSVTFMRSSGEMTTLRYRLKGKR